MRLDLNWLEFLSPSPRLEILNQRAANLTLFIKCHAAITKLHQRGCRRKKNNDSSEIVILQLAKWILMLNWLLKEGKERERKKKNSLEKKDGRNGSESAPQMVGNCLMTSLKLLEDSEERQFYETPTHTHTHTHTHAHTHTHTHTLQAPLFIKVYWRPANKYLRRFQLFNTVDIYRPVWMECGKLFSCRWLHIRAGCIYYSVLNRGRRVV